MTTALISFGAALDSLIPAAIRSNIKHKRSRSMPISRVHPILADFQSQLRAKVQILMQQQQHPESYNFSGSWLGQVLEVVLFIYSNVEDLYRHMEIDNNLDGKWLSQHMEDVVILLDVCNVLRESVSEMKKHNMSVQIALHGLLHATAKGPCASSHDHTMNSQVVEAKITSLGSCRDALRKNKDMKSKLEKCMSTLRRMGDGLHSTRTTSTSVGGSGVEEAIKEAKAVTIIACTSLVASLSFNTPSRFFSPGAGFLKKKNNKISPITDINYMINMMQYRIKEAVEMQRKRSSSSMFLLHELDRADITLGNLNNLLGRHVMNKTSKPSSKLQDELKDSIDVANMSTTELENALTQIDEKINDLYRSLVSSRVALLNSFTSLSS